MADLMEPKVFGIGFQKTGTKTLRKVYWELGYTVKSGGSEIVPRLMQGDLTPAYELADAHDAFEDHPWPNLYKAMDVRYPGSKFILTTRDEASWIASAVNHLGCLPDKSQTYTYGIGFPAGYEDVFLNRFRSHYAEVREYFRDRPGDLLEVCWEDGSGWKEICGFLGKPVPDAAFPHANRGSYTPGKRRIWSITGAAIAALRGVPASNRQARGEDANS